MNLVKKTDEWVKHNLLSTDQQADIIAFETGKRKPFRVLSLIWLALLSLFLGLVSFVADYWSIIPDWVKLVGAGVLLASGLITTIYFFKKERKILAESGLFFTFLMIGGGVGLVAQIFNFPVDSGEGFLVWAVLSFFLVLASRQELLPLIWIALLLGGLLGYMRLELLLLFFSQTPVFAVCVCAGILLGLIFLSDLVQRPFSRAVNRWAIVLYYVVLMLAEETMHHVMESFGVSVVFLALLALYAVYKGRMRLFNWTLFFIAIRFVLLYFQVFESLGLAGGWLMLNGLILLTVVGVIRIWQNHKSTGK